MNSDFEVDKLVLSVPEAGALLGCGRNKSYELAKQGKLPVIRLNGRLVVPRERFMRWLNGEEENNNQAHRA